MSGRKGLTVIEVMVSVVVLAVGILLTIGAISFSVKATYSAAQNTEATAYSRRILEILMTPGARAAATNQGANPLYSNFVTRSLYSGDDGPPEPFRSADFIRSGDPRDLKRFADAAARYTFSIRVEPYQDTAGGDYTRSLFMVNVEMRWRDKTGPRTLRTAGLFRRG